MPCNAGRTALSLLPMGTHYAGHTFLDDQGQKQSQGFLQVMLHDKVMGRDVLFVTTHLKAKEGSDCEVVRMKQVCTGRRSNAFGGGTCILQGRILLVSTYHAPGVGMQLTSASMRLRMHAACVLRPLSVQHKAHEGLPVALSGAHTQAVQPSDQPHVPPAQPHQASSCAAQRECSAWPSWLFCTPSFPYHLVYLTTMHAAKANASPPSLQPPNPHLHPTQARQLLRSISATLSREAAVGNGASSSSTDNGNGNGYGHGPAAFEASALPTTTDESMDDLASSSHVPVVITGDFNTVPDSGTCQVRTCASALAMGVCGDGDVCVHAREYVCVNVYVCDFGHVWVHLDSCVWRGGRG